MRILLTRAVTFRATHRMANPEWSDEENRRRFGPAADPPGHSHDYSCEVTVAGPVDERLAMVMDLSRLDAILNDEVIARFAGKQIERDLPALRGVLPTCEALARDVFRRVAARLPTGVTLTRVRVAEDPTFYAECFGDA